MRDILRAAIEKAFDPSQLEDAIVENVGEFIDYDDIACALLQRRRGDVEDLALCVAEDLL